MEKSNVTPLVPKDEKKIMRLISALFHQEK